MLSCAEAADKRQSLPSQRNGMQAVAWKKGDFLSQLWSTQRIEHRPEVVEQPHEHTFLLALVLQAGASSASQPPGAPVEGDVPASSAKRPPF